MLQAELRHGIEPVAHQQRIAGRIDAATVLGEIGTLGDDIQAGEQGQPFVEHRTHDMQVALGAKQLEGEQTAQGMSGRDHLRAGQSAAANDAIEVEFGQRGQEQEQAAELGAERPWFEVQGTHVGAIGGGRLDARGPLVVPAAWQLDKAFLTKDGAHGDGGALDTFRLQGFADIVDGLVLLAEFDDPLSDRLGGSAPGKVGSTKNVGWGRGGTDERVDASCRRCTRSRGRLRGRADGRRSRPAGPRIADGWCSAGRRKT